MKVFTDFHHLGLLYSLQLLFEKRLGWELYRPIGLDWYTEGFWNVYPHPDTAKQFLMDGYYPKDQTPPLNSITRVDNGIHYIKDTTHDVEQKAITLEQFKEMDIDIVIASIPAHIKLFKNLIYNYKPKAKFIFQQGNMFHEVLNNLHEIPNLLSSTIDFPLPPGCNAVFYHQEFNTEIFKSDGHKPEKKITSFINLLPQTKWGSEFYQMMGLMPEYEFRDYGILCHSGIISGITNIASIMKQSKWGFHSKYLGDGFGHILYNWYASGKPVITHISDYKDKLGGELLRDGETCIDIENRGVLGTTEYIKNLSGTQYEYICQQAYKVFKEKVNYDVEEVKIRSFLEKLNG